MSMDARRHMTMHHRMGVPRCVWYPRRPWCGAPTWVKFGVSNLGTGIANGFKRGGRAQAGLTRALSRLRWRSFSGLGPQAALDQPPQGLAFRADPLAKPEVADLSPQAFGQRDGFAYDRIINRLFHALHIHHWCASRIGAKQRCCNWCVWCILVLKRAAGRPISRGDECGGRRSPQPPGTRLRGAPSLTDACPRNWPSGAAWAKPVGLNW